MRVGYEEQYNILLGNHIKTKVVHGELGFRRTKQVDRIRWMQTYCV
ncbi:hypothetical protein VIBNISOn1_1390038 [Vibrio nigripulchritudo SOn1]|uniref:Transposase n=1 Tax=Vibrio nigripulchritudo SOn1 TaxID=1238450 RepID=A0AAV2VKZ4_9VIBR|nr:hypothetical protein VIBNISOn1_1390038 [Vibrio nigripulchritudo SOn1]